MKDSYTKLEFLVPELVELLGKKTKIPGRDFEEIVKLMKKSLGSAFVSYGYIHGYTGPAKMIVTVDRNKLECSVETVEELVDLMKKCIAQARDTIENPPEGTRYTKLNEAKQLVKISGKLGNVDDQKKIAEWEDSYEPVEIVCRDICRTGMKCNSNLRPCLKMLGFRFDGQYIECSIDEDTLDAIHDVLFGYQHGDVKAFDVSIQGFKNKLGKYKDVKLVGLEQS